MSNFSGTITNAHTKETKTFYVRKRPVHLRPGATSAPFSQLTEGEVALLVDDPDFDFEGTVEIIKFANFRDYEVLGVYSTEEEVEVPVDDVVSEEPEEKVIEAPEEAEEDRPEETIADEGEGTAEGFSEPQDDAEDATPDPLDPEDPKDGPELLKAARKGRGAEELTKAFHKPAFVAAMEMMGLEAEGTKDELAEALVAAVRG